MALVTKPPALDESMNTTEGTSRNIADVLAQELSGIATAISGGSDKVPKTDIATVEPTNVASRAYSVGELVYVNGNLYKVITAISGGATFTVGTNIQSANVSNRVKEVDDSVSALATKLTPRKIYGGYISFTTGLGALAYSNIPYTTFVPCICQVTTATNCPCVMTVDHVGNTLLFTLPISTGFSGSLYVNVYGFGWN